MIIVRGKIGMEVRSVRRLVLLLALCVVAVTTWSCIEEIQPKTNNQPRVWFTRAPEKGGVVYQNAAIFEWTATDFDDDLGMGETYVGLQPYLPCRWDTFTVCNARGDSCRLDSQFVCIYPMELMAGPVRVYENRYLIANLLDSTYMFSVIVRDGRGAETAVSREFTVQFDDRSPKIDELVCPGKRDDPVYTFTFVIRAHDRARNASAATPWDSLSYWYRLTVPSGGPSYESPDFKLADSTYTASIDGQTFKGEYKFRAKVMDKAGNVSTEASCKFEAGTTGPK
jgi:hypothetical protein